MHNKHELKAHRILESFDPSRPLEPSGTNDGYDFLRLAIISVIKSRRIPSSTVRILEALFRTENSVFKWPLSGHEPAYCMPPWQGWLLKEIYEQYEQQGNIRNIITASYRKVYQYHQHLYHHRDPEEEGLACICFSNEIVAASAPEFQPWAGHTGGQSNERFALQDPLYNALLCWSNEAMIELGWLLEVDIGELFLWQELTIHSIGEKLWNPATGMYQAYDLKKKQPVSLIGLPGLLPLCAGSATQEDAEQMLAILAGAGFGAGREEVLLCPTYPLGQPGFKAEDKWAGAISLLANWLLVQGMERYEMTKEAAIIKDSSLRLIRHYGFRDFYPSIPGVSAQVPDKESCLAAAIYLDFL
jgi:hypothetical protein